MGVMEAVKQKKSTYLEQFARLEPQLCSAEPTWFRRRRKEAMLYFEETGFPTTGEETWRHTDIRPLTAIDFNLDAEPADLEKQSLEKGPFRRLSEKRLVFVNGRFCRELSSDVDLEGVRVDLFSDLVEADFEILEQHLGRYAPETEHPFQALNLAFMTDGVLIQTETRAVAQEAIQLLYINLPGSTPQMTHPRTLILAGENSQVSVIECHLAFEDGVYFTNPVTEVVAAEGAVVDYYRLQHESNQAFHIASFESTQARSSSVRNFTITLGGRIVRNQTGAVLDGEGAWAELDGLFLVSGESLVDNFTRLEHARPHGDSREVYRGILKDKGRGVFRGRILVAKGAQKTDSKQTNRNLLLSDEALINTKPQLEIYADDVKCTHGATIGQLDADAIFYLRSRGIDAKAAESVLIYAFANDLVRQIKVDSLREQLDNYLFEWLPRGDLVREAV